MDDADAIALVPRVEEFIREVAGRDREGVWACFEHTPAETLAVLAAELVVTSRKRVNELERVELAYVRQSTVLQEQKRRVAELRDLMRVKTSQSLMNKKGRAA